MKLQGNHLKLQLHKNRGKDESDDWGLPGIDSWVFEETDVTRRHAMGKRLDNGMGWVDWSGPLYLSHINAGSRSSSLGKLVIFTKFLPSKVHSGELKSCQLREKDFVYFLWLL